MSRRKFLDSVTDLWVPGYVFAVIVGALNHDPRAVSDVAYGATVIFLIGGALLFLRRPKRIEFSQLSAIPFVLFGLWLYGVAVGLASGTSPNMVFRNFAGMALFPFVYGMIVALKPDPKHLVNALVFGGVGFVSAVTYLLLTVHPQGTVDSIGLMTFRYHYFLAAMPAIAVMLMISFRAVVFRDGDHRYFLLAPAIFVCVFYSGSRAFYAALAITMLVLAFSLVPRWTLFFRSIVLGVGLLISGVFLAILISGGAGEMQVAVTQSIEMEFGSSSPRSEQFLAMIPELNFFGHGLGAALGSGYVRDLVYTYAFELSYISLAHKLGFGGLIVFLGCVASHLFQTIRLLTLSNFRAEMIIAVGAMSFLVSSWWNPALFAPLFVVLFCVSIYIRQSISAEYSAAA